MSTAVSIAVNTAVSTVVGTAFITVVTTAATTVVNRLLILKDPLVLLLMQKVKTYSHVCNPMSIIQMSFNKHYYFRVKPAL